MLVEMARVLYLFAPLICASMLSAVVLRFDLGSRLARPIDGGRTFRGARVLGDSKTWRGIAVAVVGGAIGAAIQRYAIGDRARSLALVDYHRIPAIAFGAAMGAGAMLGELPNSFTKRRLGIAPGKTTTGPARAVFYVWDQIDLLSGSWPLIARWVHPTLALVATSVALALLVHPTISLIGYALGARRTAR